MRVDFGVALVRGLSNFEKTRAHATTFKTLNDELDTQHKTRVALRKPWLEARQDVRFADWNADQVIRTFQNAAKIADGGKAGAITKAVLPEGSSAEIAPSGAAQLPAITALITRVKESRAAGVDALRTAELPKLEAARTQLETAVTAYQGAREAYDAAFAKERGIRDEHRLAVDALMGTVRSMFPGDKSTQDVVFPDTAVTRGGDEEPAADTDPPEA